jgi:hypothetical protein
MEIQPDFRDLLKLFDDHQVEYIIVGAYALALHGTPRFTGDIDLYVKPDASNAKKIMKALLDFGFGSLDLSPSDFEKEDHVIEVPRILRENTNKMVTCCHKIFSFS